MIDHSQGFRIFGCNHDSAGIPVNSVAESRSKRILFLRTPFTFYGEIGLDVRNQSVIVPGSVTVTKNTRFFIDKKQVGILINNIQFRTSDLQPGVILARFFKKLVIYIQGEQITRTQSVIALNRFPVAFDPL